MKTRHLWPLLVLVLLVAAGGCNRSGLVRAGGKLTYRGQPVPSTYVAFHPEEGKRASHGLTDDNGNFTLTNSRTEVGVYLGRHTVSLRYFPSNEEELGQGPPKASRELKAIIHKYADPDKSTLHYEVTKDGQFFDIQLE
jgi:hypothetical protein